MIENKTYKVIGQRKVELLHPTGGYIRQVFGKGVSEIRHKIGQPEEHIYFFGKDLGNTYVNIIKRDDVVSVHIVGEKEGHRTTKSQLENKFDIKLVKELLDSIK